MLYEVITDLVTKDISRLAEVDVPVEADDVGTRLFDQFEHCAAVFDSYNFV